MRRDDLINDCLHPFAMEPADTAIFTKKLVNHPLNATPSQHTRREIIQTVIDKILAHHRHRAEHAGHPILVGGHTTLLTMRSKHCPVNCPLSDLVQAVSLIHQLSRGSHSTSKNLTGFLQNHHRGNFLRILSIAQ